MKTIVLSAILSVSLLASSIGQCETLDDIVKELANDSLFNPFVAGVQKSIEHPKYHELIQFAQRFGSEVRWVPSISRAVIALPFHKDRMAVKRLKAKNDFDGWFDEFTKPNLILLDDKAKLIILVHELRHAVQLGTHGLTSGTWFDRLLQQNKRRISRFYQKVEKSNLPDLQKENLKHLATRLIETCSEISAHEGDVVLSQAFNRDVLNGYIDLVEEYKIEYEQSYTALMQHSLSRNEPFVRDLNDGLNDFLIEKGL